MTKKTAVIEKGRQKEGKILDQPEDKKRARGTFFIYIHSYLGSVAKPRWLASRVNSWIIIEQAGWRNRNITISHGHCYSVTDHNG